MPQVQEPHEINIHCEAISAPHTSFACNSPDQGVDPPHNIHTITRIHKRRRINNARLGRQSASSATLTYIPVHSDHLDDALAQYSNPHNSTPHTPPALTPGHEPSARSAEGCGQPEAQPTGSAPLTSKARGRAFGSIRARFAHKGGGLRSQPHQLRAARRLMH